MVSGSARESSRPPLPPPKDTAWKEKPPEEIKTPLPQKPIKELVAELVEIEIPAIVPAVMLATTPVAIPAAKAKKTKSSKPSPWKLSLRKIKEQTPESEFEKEEESMEETESFGGGAKSNEEVELATP